MNLHKVMTGDQLSREEARQLVEAMMSGSVSREEMAAVLAVLSYRGETAEEIAGFASGMINKAVNVELPMPLLDTCGTGGDEAGTYNISTASAILLSALGVPVAKHGNRSVSSKSGSADVLEELNVPFQTGQTAAETRLKEHHLTFFFAPFYHEAMKHVAPVRKALGRRTIFNLLGPLTNPAQASHRVIGVYSREAASKMAEAARLLNIERVLFVTGEDGLDEVTTQGVSHVIEVFDGQRREYDVTPEDFGMSRTSLEGATAADAAESASIILQVFNKEGSRAAEQLLLLNAAAGLYTAGRASTWKEGVELASEALGSTVLQHMEALQTKERNKA
ncbi:anthranilate phosphoribosyltransferase [Alkalicoccus chagannorensis]|uniref:anthranilate phosphoribosyltransferase n=1 Tax=Alkalicoccus chagannorensis TaxID=427072 RepID=UPI00040D0FBE|nr:anthranilate phosphoribosyltransferase [Alkalicoccus chagannorensis]